jgi:hypothetical protein
MTDSFGELSLGPDGGEVVMVNEDGAVRMGIGFLPPCECACQGVLVDGVLYGPARDAEVGAAVQALPADLDWAIGDLSRFAATDGLKPTAALSALFERYCGGA